MKRLLVVLLLGLTGCANLPEPQHVLDRHLTLGRLAQESIPLPAGHYRLEITASGDGVSIDWRGGACADLKGVRSLQTDCTLTQSGQLIISNPDLLTLQSSRSVTLQLWRLR